MPLSILAISQPAAWVFFPLFSLRISIKLQINPTQLDKSLTPSPSFLQTHPNVDNQAFNQRGVIGLKHPEKPFPINQDVGVLKWRMQTSDEALMPLTSKEIIQRFI